MARPKINDFQARKIVVNAVVYGSRIVLFKNNGRMILETQRSDFEGPDDFGRLPDQKWLAFLEIKLWRLTQQIWKAEQDPWKRKAYTLASTFRHSEWKRKVGKAIHSRRERKVRWTWDNASKYLANLAHEEAYRHRKCNWTKWAGRVVGNLNTQRRYGRWRGQARDQAQASRHRLSWNSSSDSTTDAPSAAGN